MEVPAERCHRAGCGIVGSPTPNTLKGTILHPWRARSNTSTEGDDGAARVFLSAQRHVSQMRVVPQNASQHPLCLWTVECAGRHANQAHVRLPRGQRRSVSSVRHRAGRWGRALPSTFACVMRHCNHAACVPCAHLHGSRAGQMATRLLLLRHPPSSQRHPPSSQRHPPSSQRHPAS